MRHGEGETEARGTISPYPETGPAICEAVIALTRHRRGHREQFVMERF
jgi:hypothetical protein